LENLIPPVAYHTARFDRSDGFNQLIGQVGYQKNWETCPVSEPLAKIFTDIKFVTSIPHLQLVTIYAAKVFDVNVLELWISW